MNDIDDLKIIRKKYGEKMAHFCRDNFASLLETTGLLSNVLLHKFHESHLLYDDIMEQHKDRDFKNYIYNLVNYQHDDTVKIDKSPEELMDEAGYILKECYSEEEIQEYKKYYAPGESLCTFKGNRLDRCRVFFAVKKNVDEIKREDFKVPRRQDEYGTSVISIQFTKDDANILSIKNRYNHRVSNPDATFSNNLDNIIAGLTDSFEQYKGIRQIFYSSKSFNLDNYVMANDGKYYKYNYEIFNVYFCPDNIIIDNFKVEKYDKSRYLIMDYYILDMAKGNKDISIYNDITYDSFIDAIEDITSIEVENIDTGKIVVVANDKGNSLEILLNKSNQIVGLKINGVLEVGINFMYHNDTLTEFQADELVKVGYNFLNANMSLEELSLPSLREANDNFMQCNEELSELYVPNLEVVGNNFIEHNKNLQKLEVPYLREVGWFFMGHNQSIKELNLPSLTKIGGNFMTQNNSLVSLNIPKLTSTSQMMLQSNTTLERMEAPELAILKFRTLASNKKLQSLEVPKLETIENYALNSNQELRNKLISQIEERTNSKGGRR